MANSQEQTKPVAWRPEVVAFASLMERELRENDWKGGWKHCNFASLMSHVWEEARELQEALLSYPRDTQKYRERIASEGADIANMVMMVLDVRGALSPSPAPPAESERIAAPTRLWLWRNWVDGRPEYLAFDNPYPLFMDIDDPQTLGEPCGYAIVKPSRRGRPDVSDEDAAKRIKSDAERIAALEAALEQARWELEVCKEREYNPFEPGNQSGHYQRLRAALRKIEEVQK